MYSTASLDIQMPLEIARQRELEDRWTRVRGAFEESVRQIQERTNPAEQPALLARAVAQFQRHVEGLQGDLPALVYPVAEELGKIAKGETLQAKVLRAERAMQGLL